MVGVDFVDNLLVRWGCDMDCGAHDSVPGRAASAQRFDHRHEISLMNDLSHDPRNLSQEAMWMRRKILSMAYGAGSGHCGGSLSCVEILLTLFFRVLRLRPHQPDWETRDRFLLSKGHAAPALYTVLARAGYFPEATLNSLRAFGSILQGHPDMRKVPGVEMTSGSLGMGISNGIGMAWSARHTGQTWRTFVLVGDGELNEGQNWEAAMLAAKLELSNLIVIVDANGVQLDGPTDEVMPLGDLGAKFRAFGWATSTCDGHDFASLQTAFQKGISSERPSAILAQTVKGKGVSFMEGNALWHGAPLTEPLYQAALGELAAEEGEVVGHE